MNKIKGLTKVAARLLCVSKDYRAAHRAFLRPAGCRGRSYIPPRFNPKSRLAPNLGKKY